MLGTGRIIVCSMSGISFRHLKARTEEVKNLSLSFLDYPAFVNSCKYILRFVKRVIMKFVIK